jgi:ferredoxin
MNDDETSKVPRFNVKRLNKPPYDVDQSRMNRFDSRNIIFNRVTRDSSWEGYMRMYDESVQYLVTAGKHGYSRVDFALSYASWIVHDAFKGGFSWRKINTHRDSVASVGIDWAKPRYEVQNPRIMSAIIKRAAKLFGASLVGVCKLNRDWLYADVDVPKEFDNAIVMAVEMDAEGIATSPAATAAAATGVGYSKMAFILALMGEFVRNLGYEALQCGNDTMLSIPLAIDAGLGELGRNGLLITPQYGPRVRLCKVITNLSLKPDKPIEFGVKKFCKKCKLCAENCKVSAISKDDEPSYTATCKSNNAGALKWYVDFEQCYLYWCDNGVDCSTCIKVCPYNIASSGNKRLSLKEFWGEKIESTSKI